MRKVNKFEKTKQLNAFIDKIAKGIGYNKAITSANYQDILNEYNKYDKLRVYDETMSKAASKVESSKANRNFNNYYFYDVNNLTTPLVDKPQLNKDDELIINANINSIGGKMFQTGYIKHPNASDGTPVPITPIVVRSRDEISNNYHDAITSSTMKAVEYESGQNKGTPRANAEGTYSLNTKIMPGIGTLETVGSKNPDGKKVTSFILTPISTKENPNPKSIIYTSQAQAQRELNAMYYSTESGQVAASELATPAVIYKTYNDDVEESNWLQNP